MKVLILTLNAWNSSNSTGNTISNLFSEISENDEVANIYCRNDVSDTSRLPRMIFFIMCSQQIYAVML